MLTVIFFFKAHSKVIKGRGVHVDARLSLLKDRQWDRNYKLEFRGR